MIPPQPRSTLFPYTTLFRSLSLFVSKSLSPLVPQSLRLQVPQSLSPLVPQSLSLEITQSRKIDLTTMTRSEEHTSELQSRPHLVCRLLLEKKKKNKTNSITQ